MSDPLAATSSALPTRYGSSVISTASQTADSSSLAAKWNALLRGTNASPKDALKLCAVEGKIAQDQSASLRWIQWKLFLTEHISSIPSSWSATLKQEREAYNELRCRLLRAPDGNYPPEVGFDGTHTTLDSASANSARNGRIAVKDLSVNNPLSLDDSNPWKTYYTTLETRRVILQDVERTFPDLDLFRHTHVQQSLTNILFLWTLENEDVGYRQGMHELAAALWKVRTDGAVDARGLSNIRSSTSAQASPDAPFQPALADVFIEHDVYTLFCSLMQSAKSWFVWRDSSSAPAANASSPTTSSRRSATQQRPVETTRAPLPIVAKCEHILELLRHIDPALAQHLQSLEIEPQIFCLRWIRMIFTREFALDDAFAIWDGLFASGLDLIDHVCIAMLLRIRNELLAGDHTSALQSLLRYPAGAQAQPSLLVKQAIFMRDSALLPSVGVAVVMQNRDLLGIAVRAVYGPGSSQEPSWKAPASPTQRFNAQKYATVGRSPSGTASRPSPWGRMQDTGSAPQSARPIAARRWQPTATAADPLGATQASISNLDANGQRSFGINPTAYLPEGISDLAKGWYERSELPQSLNSALANVSRTVAAAANAYGSTKVEKSGFPSGFEQAFSSQTGLRAASSSNIDRASPGLVEQQLPAAESQIRESSPPQLSSRDLAERSSKVTTTNKAIGSALSACIEVLEQSWLDQSARVGRQSQDSLQQSDLNTLMSFTALKHIRDVLEGTASEFDPATLPARVAKQTIPFNEATDLAVRISEASTQQRSLAERDYRSNATATASPVLPMSLPEYARYGRQMILPDFGLPGQLRLRKAKVLVVGAGGLGCPAVQYLAAAGVGHISILDHDVVEPSNLARQILHSDATVGMPKAVSAADAAKRINPYITATPLSEAISAVNARQIMRGQDLVLDCTDNPLTRYLISDAAVMEGVQVVSGAAQGYDGQLVVLHKRIKAEFAGPRAGSEGSDKIVRGPCYRCLFPQAPKPDEVTNCEDGGVLGGVTGLVGTMQALEAVKILAGIGEDTPPLLTLVSPLTASPFRSVKIRPRRIASCRSCGDPAQVKEPMIKDLESEDYISFCGLNNSPTQGHLARTAVRAMKPSLILDVRPSVEYGITKLDGSINLPIQTLVKNPAQAWEMIREAQRQSAAQDILVVCKKGNDSQIAVKALLDHQKQETPSGEDPLSNKSATRKGEARQEIKAIEISDLIGGLRAYSKEKDPLFPVY